MTASAVPLRDADGPDGRRERAGLLTEAADFLRSHALVILLSLIGMALAHGLAVASQSLSVDEELFATRNIAGGYAEQGRPAISFFKVLLARTLPLPFLGPAMSLILLFATATAWAFLFTRASGRPARPMGLLLFLVVFTTLPTQAYYLMWNAVGLEFSIGLLVAGISAWMAWLWAFEGWGRTAAAASVTLGVVAGLTYQSLLFVALAGLLVAQLAHMLATNRVPTSRAAMMSLRLVAPTSFALVVSAVISVALIPPGSYWASFMRWGSAPPDVLFGALMDGIAKYVVGDGFVGGWVLLFSVGAWLGLLVVLILRASRGEGWYGLVLYAAISFLPFANSVAVGTLLPNRTMQALSLVAGAAWFLLVLAMPQRRQITPLLAGAALLLWAWQAGITTRLYHVEITTYEIDRSIAAEVTERLVRQGWDGRELPLVSVGTRPPSAVEALADHDSFGLSFFNQLDDGARAPAFVIALGHAVRRPTALERQAGLDRSSSMPVWPAAESVVLEDGLAIVKFATPEEQ
jgi:hypothetical protein